MLFSVTHVKTRIIQARNTDMTELKEYKSLNERLWFELEQAVTDRDHGWCSAPKGIAGQCSP